MVSSIYTVSQKSDNIADFLITCNNLYRIKYNFINICLHVLQTVMQSFWKIHLSVTQKSNCKRNDKRCDCTTIQWQLAISQTMTMFKSDVQSSAFFADTVTQTPSPLADCSVDDTLIKAVPFVNQSLFQMVDVTDLATVHALLQNVPDRVVNRNAAGKSVKW